MLKNMKIAMKLGAGFGVILILLISLALFSLSKLQDTQDKYNYTVDVGMTKLETINNLLDASNLISRLARDLVLTQDTNKLNEIVSEIKETRNIYPKNIDTLKKFAETPEAKNRISESEQKINKVGIENNKVIDLASVNRDTEATELLWGSARTAQDDLINTLLSLIKQENDLIHADVQAAREDYKSALFTLISLSIFAVVFGIVAAFVITRSITKPLSMAVSTAEAIARGDISSQISVTSTEETGQLLKAMQAMQHSLIGIINDIKKSGSASQSG